MSLDEKKGCQEVNELHALATQAFFVLRNVFQLSDLLQYQQP